MTLRVTPSQIVNEAEASGRPGLLAKAPGWSRIQVAEVARVVNGAPFDSALFNREQSGMPLVRIRDVGANSVSTWYDGRWDEVHRVRRGDLLIGMDGNFLIDRWRLEDAVLNQRVCRIDVDESKYNSRFLELAIQGYLDAVWARTSSTTVKHLSSRTIAAIPLPQPPLDEQHRIVEILEEHLSRLEVAHRLLTISGRRLRASIRAVLMDLIPSPEGYLPHWIPATVGSAGSVELGRQRHPDWHHGPNMRPYLRVANVFEDRIDTSDVMSMHWDDSTFERFRLRQGDILLNEGQSPELLGRPAMYRGSSEAVAFTNSLIRFRARDDVLPEFALLVFRRHMHSGRFRRESRITTNIAHLSASRLKPIEFPIPPIDEQRQIIALASEQLDAIYQLNAFLDGKMQNRSTALRRALLQAAFSGQLTGRASDLDRADELVSA